MSLSERDRQRYARHLLLTQLGEAGQARLLSAVVHAGAEADPGALEVARTYLERAGVRVTVHDSVPEHGTHADRLALPTRAEVERVAGTAPLEEAARALLGALAAVTAIQHAAGLSPAGPRATERTPTHSQSFAISSEDA